MKEEKIKIEKYSTFQAVHTLASSVVRIQSGQFLCRTIFLLTLLFDLAADSYRVQGVQQD